MKIQQSKIADGVLIRSLPRNHKGFQSSSAVPLGLHLDVFLQPLTLLNGQVVSSTMRTSEHLFYPPPAHSLSLLLNNEYRKTKGL